MLMNTTFLEDSFLIKWQSRGVPQNRQRVLFVGTRKDLNIEFEFPKKQSKEAGMNEHLSKPLDEKKLMNTIWKYTIGKNSNSKE